MKQQCDLSLECCPQAGGQAAVGDTTGRGAKKSEAPSPTLAHLPPPPHTVALKTHSTGSWWHGGGPSPPDVLHQAPPASHIGPSGLLLCLLLFPCHSVNLSYHPQALAVIPTSTPKPVWDPVLLITWFAVGGGGSLLRGAGAGALAPHHQLLAAQARLLLQLTLHERQAGLGDRASPRVPAARGTYQGSHACLPHWK